MTSLQIYYLPELAQGGGVDGFIDRTCEMTKISINEQKSHGWVVNSYVLYGFIIRDIVHPVCELNGDSLFKSVRRCADVAVYLAVCSCILCTWPDCQVAVSSRMYAMAKELHRTIQTSCTNNTGKQYHIARFNMYHMNGFIFHPNTSAIYKSWKRSGRSFTSVRYVHVASTVWCCKKKK